MTGSAKPKEIQENVDIPLAHKIYEAHVLRDNFKDKVSWFLNWDSEDELILDEIVDSPLKIDILERFWQQIIWQEEAKKHLADSIIDAIETVRDKENWPLKVLFFAWNTWVGKTEILRVLAEICFWFKRWLTVIPCEQYQDKYSVKNLLWSTKGYVWYWDSTPFSDINLFKPYREARQEKNLHESLYRLDDFAILLFDEIEKAEWWFKQALIWIMSSGIHEFPSWSEDNPKEYAYSKITDFKNVVMVFTSNLWTKQVQKRSIWFWANDTHNEYNRTTKIYEEELRKHFSPEFLWRIDEFIYFHDLSEEHCRKIILKELNELNEVYGMCYDFRVKIEITEEATQRILKDWFDTKTWARKMKRVIFKNIEKRINNFLVWWAMEDTLPEDKVTRFKVDYDGNKFVYKVKKLPLSTTTQSKATTIIQHVLKKKKAWLVVNSQFPDIVKVLPEVMLLQDRYRRIYHMHNKMWINLEPDLKVYEFMLREIGHTSKDIEYQRQMAENEIFDPKDVFSALTFDCDFLVSGPSFFMREDQLIDSIIEAVLKKWWNKSQEKIRNKIFRYMEFFLWKELDKEQTKLLHSLISKKIYWEWE